MKVAIVHDWLTGMRGGEKCLEVFCELFPKAALFTLLHKKGSVSKTIEAMDIRTSFIQKLPFASAHYRNYLPLFPMAIESFDLSGYDIVLSSSHCAAKGVRAPKDSLHICYCYTPMRYAWVAFDDYFKRENGFKKRVISYILGRLKAWDIKTNENVDFFIAISHNVENRIKRFYNRESVVIYPPVDTDRFEVSYSDDNFYLIVSALVPYKRIDLAIEAFNILQSKLVIIGSGDEEQRLKKTAGDNIEFLGWLDDLKTAEYYSRCRALIFPGEEDFGIVPLEAHACGKPVIAYAKGGALETITQETGVFFYEQTADALIEAIKRFETTRDKFNPQIIRQNTERFKKEIFKEKIKRFIEKKNA